MLAVEELLQPIDPAAEAGRNLRYDPVFDSIREALSEDDGSLPMGSWVRQVKRADHTLVIALTQEALRKRTKDLWLAGWLGEASIEVEGSNALEPALRLIVGLQQRFWLSIFPEIEDGDTSLRAAPVQRCLDRFAILLEKTPITDDGLPYSAYKAVRAGVPWSENERSITADTLDEALRATPIDFYVRANLTLTQALNTLGELQSFCSDHYGEDGPSFAALRGALEELHGLIAQQLRLRPDEGDVSSAAVQAASEPATISESVEDERDEVSETALPEQPVNATPTEQAGAEPEQFATAAPRSWEEAMSRIKTCATYMFEQRPADPACYLLAMALRQGRDGTNANSFPSPDTRLALKRAFDSEDWTALMIQSLRAVSAGDTSRWLDPQHYAWQAAAHLDGKHLQGMIAALLSEQLEENSAWPDESFDDDTPVANGKTRHWLKNDVMRRSDVSPVKDVPVFVPPPAPVEHADDVFVPAAFLLEQGEPEQAIKLLTDAVASTQSGRDTFLIQMEIGRICLKADKKPLAANILRQLLVESKNLRLEHWEGRSLSGRLLSMLLTATDEDETALEERRNIYSRLCALDAVQAFTVSPPC